MQKFKVLTPVTFRIGRFRLTDAQLARRKHVVRVSESGLAEPIAEISFKAGEIIETDIDVPKGLHGKLEPVVEAVAEVQVIDAPAEVSFAAAKRATLKLGK